jgi:nucleotide-binding universal stress UspA family protein
VTLLHVIQSVERLPTGELRDFYRKLTAVSSRKLDRAAKPFAGRVRVRTEVCVGEPAREIIRVSLRDRVGLIVMGSHKVRPDRAARWGTTSYKVGQVIQKEGAPDEALAP